LALIPVGAGGRRHTPAGLVPPAGLAERLPGFRASLLEWILGTGSCPALLPALVRAAVCFKLGFLPGPGRCFDLPRE
jgi:hypothetical protein